MPNWTLRILPHQFLYFSWRLLLSLHIECCWNAATRLIADFLDAVGAQTAHHLTRLCHFSFSNSFMWGAQPNYKRTWVYGSQLKLLQAPWRSQRMIWRRLSFRFSIANIPLTLLWISYEYCVKLHDSHFCFPFQLQICQETNHRVLPSHALFFPIMPWLPRSHWRPTKSSSR